MKQEFEDLYESMNISEIKEFWELALKDKKKARVISLVAILIIDLVILGVLLKRLDGLSEFVHQLPYFIISTLFIDIMILFIFAIVSNTRNVKIYNMEFKEEAIEKLLECALEKVDYIPQKGMPKYIYDEGKYTEFYNRYYSDDYVQAKLDGKYNMLMAEVKTQKEETKTGSDGKTHTETTTIFHGLFLKINIGKSINNELKIKQNGIFSKYKLDMDSQEFEKYFDVTSTDKIVGMQLLTHDIMELLVSFRKIIKKTFDIIIRDDIMYIRLHIGAMFEPKINKKEVLDKEILRRYYNILDIVCTLSKKMAENVNDTQI